jgi:hypothetical protein
VPTTLKFDQQVSRLIESYKVKAQGGWTWTEMMAYFDEFTEEVMVIAAEFNLEGVDKKAYVLEAVGFLFDALVPEISVPLPWYLALLRPYLKPLVRQLVLAVASRLVERIYSAPAMFKRRAA